MAYRFVHAADIHLDSPLRSLALRDPDLANLVGNATRHALVNIVDLCIDEQVDAPFLHLAGLQSIPVGFAVMRTHFSPRADEAHEIVGEICHADFGRGAGDADRADEELHLRLLPREDMLDEGADF